MTGTTFSRNLIVGVSLLFTATMAFSRTVLLNGIDISSARNQILKNVSVKIDENGNFYIEAPHYQVNEENTFTPLSTWLQGVSGPKHEPPQALPKGLNSVGDAQAIAPIMETDKAPPVSPGEKPVATSIDKPAASGQDKPGNKTGGG